MAEVKHFTAPQAYILVNGIKTGIMRNIRFSENITRADIQGLGNMYSQEVPATAHKCTFSAGTFFIDFEQEDMKQFINRYIESEDGQDAVQLFANTLALGDFPIAIEVYKKTITSENGNLVTGVENTGKEVITIKDMYLESQNFELSEGGFAGTDVSGRYLTPIFFNA